MRRRRAALARRPGNRKGLRFRSRGINELQTITERPFRFSTSHPAQSAAPDLPAITRRLSLSRASSTVGPSSRNLPFWEHGYREPVALITSGTAHH